MIAPKTEQHQHRPQPDQLQGASELCELDRVLVLLEVLFTQVRVGPHEELAVAGLVALRRRVATALENERHDHAVALREALLELIAELGDPHTRIGVAAGEVEAGAQQLPVRIVARRSPDHPRREYRLARLGGETAAPHGEVVTHLNGIPIHRLVAHLERWSPHHNAAARRAAALSMLTRRALASEPSPLADWVEFGGPELRWRAAWTPSDRAAFSGACLPAHDQEEGSVLASGVGWRLLREGSGIPRRLRLQSIPAASEILRIDRALAAVPQPDLRAEDRRVIVDLRGNRGGAIESVLPLARALGVHEPVGLSQQFRNTPLLRRLLAAQPQWRPCSRPADSSWLRAVPLPQRQTPTGSHGDAARCARSAQCAAVWVDGATHSAAEILGGVLQRAGVCVVGPRSGTAGGPVNAWTYPSLQALAPTAIEPLAAQCLPAARRMALQCWVARHCPLAAIHEISDDQWHLRTRTAAGRADGHIAVRYESHPPANSASGSAALVFFDRAHPTFPELPGLFGFQCGVRRTLLRYRGVELPLRRIEPDVEVDVAEGDSLGAYSSAQRVLPATPIREVA